MIELHEFKPIALDIDDDFQRADLEIYGINHLRPSYTAQVFFNAGKLDPKTCGPQTPGYVGSFSVFAHPECVGDPGHCDLRVPGRFDTRPSHPLTKAFKRVVVTEPLREVLQSSKRLQIAIIVADGEASKDAKGKKKAKKKTKKGKAAPALFACQGLQIATFV